MLKACKYLLGFSFIISVIWASQAQNRTQLQKLLDKNKTDIALTREILKETQNQKVASLQLLNVYQKQIKIRKDFIQNIGNEVSSLDHEIDIARAEISAITNELDQMKAQFGELITNGYKAQKNHSKIQFLFSSSNFNQIFKRLNYLRKLLDYRKLQLDLIVLKQEENSVKINQLIHKKNEKLMLMANREDEQAKLLKDQQREEQIIQELKSKEAELLLSIRRKQKQADQLDRQIKEAIVNEKEKPASSNNIPTIGSTENGVFGDNRGRLPWPVKSGYINEYFGVHKHAELRNIQTENNGINITVPPGSEVFPVFGGTVSVIMEVPGLKRSILLNHNGYYTVYANLEEVFVNRGETVTTSTRIGRVVKNEEGIAELHFEVWKGSEKLNPQLWLMGK